jgi:hypothetical protein
MTEVAVKSYGTYPRGICKVNSANKEYKVDPVLESTRTRVTYIDHVRGEPIHHVYWIESLRCLRAQKKVCCACFIF